MGYYYCPGCGHVFKKERVKEYNSYLAECPISDCGKKMFETDEEMIFPISILNSKGYSTRFSSSGHAFDNSHGGYIDFEDEDYIPDTVPKGWYKDGNSIRYKFGKKDTPIDKVKRIHRRVETLTKWCEELEEYEGEN